MQVPEKLSPQSLTAVEILESVDPDHRDQALEVLRNYAYDLKSEQAWQELFSIHSGPMKIMAKQAIKEHKEGRSREL